MIIPEYLPLLEQIKACMGHLDPREAQLLLDFAENTRLLAMQQSAGYISLTLYSRFSQEYPSILACLAKLYENKALKAAAHDLYEVVSQFYQALYQCDTVLKDSEIIDRWNKSSNATNAAVNHDQCNTHVAKKDHASFDAKATNKRRHKASDFTIDKSVIESKPNHAQTPTSSELSFSSHDEW